MNRGDTSTETHHHLKGRISLATVKSWCQMIRQSASIGTLAGPRGVRALKRIYKKLKTACAENRRRQLVNF